MMSSNTTKPSNSPRKRKSSYQSTSGRIADIVNDTTNDITNDITKVQSKVKDAVNTNKGYSSKKNHIEAQKNLGQDKNLTESKPQDLSRPNYKHVAVVRKKDERAALPGYECSDCEAFYKALEDAGVDVDKQRILNNCSRHKHLYEPPSTPPDFWNVSFPESETQMLL